MCREFSNGNQSQKLNETIPNDLFSIESKIKINKLENNLFSNGNYACVTSQGHIKCNIPKPKLKYVKRIVLIVIDYLSEKKSEVFCCCCYCCCLGCVYV